MATASTEPRLIQAGDTVTWTIADSEYPASDGWVLHYRLINAQGAIDITADADGADHAVTVTAATTADYVAGDYQFVGYVAKGTERHTRRRGQITVRPDLAAQTGGFEARGTWAKALDDLRTALATWIVSNGQVREYEIVGRRMVFAAEADIRGRIAIAEREAAREAGLEAAAAGQSLGRRLLVRFSK